MGKPTVSTPKAPYKKDFLTNINFLYHANRIYRWNGGVIWR